MTAYDEDKVVENSPATKDAEGMVSEVAGGGKEETFANGEEKSNSKER